MPLINRKVRSSSVVVDEEFFPWLGAKAHQPLSSSTATSRYLTDHLGSASPDDKDPDDSSFVKTGDINATPQPSLSFLNLFSGPYKRDGGLSNTMRAFGWKTVTDFDNDKYLGMTTRRLE